MLSRANIQRELRRPPGYTKSAIAWLSNLVIFWSYKLDSNSESENWTKKKNPQNISKREVSHWCCMLHLSGAQGTCRFSGFNVDWQKWVLTMFFLSLWRRYGWFDYSVIWIRILRIWVKSYILQGFTSKFVVIRRDTTLGKCGDHDAPLLSFCTRYGSEIREHRRWDWVEHQIFSSHNLLAIWKISFSFSPSLSPFFFKHLYRNVWIYFLISLFQSPFFVCVCFERSHWKFGVQDNFATLVCSEVFALWLFGNQDHDQSPGETVKTSSKEPYPGFFHLFFKGFLPKLC